MSQTSATTLTGVPRRYSAEVLRRWSDAFAGAGLFALALRVEPDDEQDLFRRAELAVLAGDHAIALRLLKEHDATRDHAEPVPPAAVLLTAVAQAQAGEPAGWQHVQDAAHAMSDTVWTSWMLALGGVTVPHLTVPHLDVAGPAARHAFDGGCRDPRLPVIAAAGVMADGDEVTWEQCSEAVDLLESSRRVQLPGEDAIGDVTDLLRRAGLVDRAQSLVVFAATDPHVARDVQDAWRVAAHAQHIHLPRRRIRLPSQRLLPRRAPRRRELICLCAGSAGWIGTDRLSYLENHLRLADAAPLPDLVARLLQCPFTGVRFLDLPELKLTLPVDHV